MLGTSLYTFLSDDAAIGALTSAIYPLALPQDHEGYPALVYTVDDNPDETMMDGQPNELREALVSIDSYDGDYVTVHTLADTVASELVGFTGTFGTKTVDHIRLLREFELPEPETRLNRVSQQYLIAYS